MSVSVEKLSSEQAAASIAALTDILIDAVADGASVSFMASMRRDEAENFWSRVAAAVEFGATALFVASDEGRPVGTVQLMLATPPNQPHRVDLSKMLVHRSARRKGVARALMEAAEAEARRMGKTLITLDTASMAAERLYEGLGYQRVGVIPGYALFPDGTACDTTIYYKTL